MSVRLSANLGQYNEPRKLANVLLYGTRTEVTYYISPVLVRLAQTPHSHNVIVTDRTGIVSNNQKRILASLVELKRVRLINVPIAHSVLLGTGDQGPSCFVRPIEAYILKGVDKGANSTRIVQWM